MALAAAACDRAPELEPSDDPAAHWHPRASVATKHGASSLPGDGKDVEPPPEPEPDEDTIRRPNPEAVAACWAVCSAFTECIAQPLANHRPDPPPRRPADPHESIGPPTYAPVVTDEFEFEHDHEDPPTPDPAATEQLGTPPDSNPDAWLRTLPSWWLDYDVQAGPSFFDIEALLHFGDPRAATRAGIEAGFDWQLTVMSAHEVGREACVATAATVVASTSYGAGDPRDPESSIAEKSDPPPENPRSSRIDCCSRCVLGHWASGRHGACAHEYETLVGCVGDLGSNCASFRSYFAREPDPRKAGHRPCADALTDFDLACARR